MLFLTMKGKIYLVVVHFFYVVYKILESRCAKSNTPLHCMAHSLVSKYYCNAQVFFLKGNLGNS